MSSKKPMSRRSFLKQCAALNALGYTGAYSALGGLSLTSQMARAQSRPSEYKAIVNVYLTGGNDLNMLIPTDDDNYQLYNDIRGDVFTLDRDDSNSVLPITSGAGNSQASYGLHASCGVVDSSHSGSGGFKKLYDEGKLAFIANTGALLEPTTVNQFLSETVALPPSIGNHLIQKDFVRAGSYINGAYTTGWAGRIADLYGIQQGEVPLNGTLLGDNIWQRGESSSTYSFNGSSVKQLFGYRNNGASSEEALRRAALDDINMLAQSQNHLFVKEYGRMVESSFALSDVLRDGANDEAIELTTIFPSTVMGARMKSIAELINARVGLGMPQQVFYVDSPGWDMHNNLIAEHASNLEELSAAMAAFYQATVEMGLQDQVITFTNSEFGRTLDPNSTGSDHAWGGNQVVMGGRVNGGQVIGEYPLFVEGDGETQFREFRGLLVPEISTDQVSSTIAKWFGGFSDSTLTDLFPNVSNFDTNDLGFII